jgi:hypothetical protein
LRDRVEAPNHEILHLAPAALHGFNALLGAGEWIHAASVASANERGFTVV